MLTHHPSATDEHTGAAHRPGSIVRRSPRERIDVRVAIGVGVTWFVLMEIVAALEPTSARPDPAIGVALGVVANVLFVGMLVGLALRRRWGLVASLAGAVLVTAMAVACPTSGHHAFGLWWYGEMVCVLALVAGSVAALRLPAPTESGSTETGAESKPTP